MRILIIEDEKLVADDLAETICQVEPNTKIISTLYSVKESIKYFRENESPIDLIFSDIQLGDGLCFEIFNKVKISSPVIFCTAFDEYALQAFKANSIDYILKPFSKSSILEALNKYKSLQTSILKSSFNYGSILDLFIKNETKQNSILVHYKDKIIPIRFENIALFYIDTEITYLLTFDNQKYSINKTLEELEKQTPNNFYRTNRQYLVNSMTIKEVSPYFSRKLSVTLKNPFQQKIIVSKEKSTDFLSWLSKH